MDVEPVAGMRLGRGSLRGAAAPWVVLGAAACGCVAVAAIDPEAHRLTPPCPFRAATGWWCPFCGGTRAVGRLVRGDVVAALRFNLLVVAALPVLALLWWGWVAPGRVRAADAVSRWGSAPRAWRVAAALGLAFVVLRNVAPLDAYLRFRGA